MKPIAGMPSSPHQSHTRSSSTFTSPCGESTKTAPVSAASAARVSARKTE